MASDSLICVVRVLFSPLCVWAELVTTCIYNVQESDYLEFYFTPVHLFVELVVFREVEFECAHDGDIVFYL